MSHHLVIGTAGHVDHGKSRLVEVLTGTHPDRLAEEQRRGITIDLGFAALDLPGFGRVGLVDVPGHEKFVRTMVAGAAGVDVVLLVVAMDEGVMPQTREHVDVCRLLGVERGVIALTKADLLEVLGDDWEHLVRSDLVDAVRGTFLEHAPIVTVSAEDERGLPALLDSLTQVARTASGRDQTGPLFMPLDRAFSMKGFGTVVTGTVLSGSLAVGDEVGITGSRGPQTTRVRGLQVHGAEVVNVGAGQRAAVNLAAISTGRIERGSVLVSKGAPVSGRLLEARMSLLETADRPIKQRSRMLVHVGTAHAEAIVVMLDGKEASPGSDKFVQLHLDRPLAVFPGQPFILRGSRVQVGRGRTAAGGRILGLAHRRRRPSRNDALDNLVELASSDPPSQVEALIRERGVKPTAEGDLPYLTGLPRRHLRKSVELLTSKKILVLADSERRLLLHREATDALEAEAFRRLNRHHDDDPLSPGISKEALRSSLPGPPPPRVFHALLASLAAKEEIETSGDKVRLRSHGGELPVDDTGSAEDLARALAGCRLAPPRLSSLSSELSLPPEKVRGICALLAGQGRLVKVKDDLYFDASAVRDLEAKLIEWLDRHGDIDTQAFKELAGVTRRHAIPLSEHFDQTHVTLRVGDKRIRRSRSATAGKRDQ